MLGFRQFYRGWCSYHRGNRANSRALCYLSVSHQRRQRWQPSGLGLEHRVGLKKITEVSFCTNLVLPAHIHIPILRRRPDYFERWQLRRQLRQGSRPKLCRGETWALPLLGYPNGNWRGDLKTYRTHILGIRNSGKANDNNNIPKILDFTLEKRHFSTLSYC